MLFLVGLAMADARQDLEDALLARSLGERQAAQDTLVRLVRSLAADDPLRGHALFWSATIHAEAGHPTQAQEALRDCIRNGPGREDCAHLLGRLELENSSMQVPGRWNFVGEHGMVQFWEQAEQGSVRIETIGGEPALTWNTRQVPQRPGMLLFAVQPGTRPTRVTLRLSTPDAQVVLLPLFMDDAGEAHRAGSPIVLSKGKQTQVHLFLDRIPGLDPAHLERVILRDLTASSDTATGSTTLTLHEVSLR